VVAGLFHRDSWQFLILLGAISPTQPANFVIEDGKLQIELIDGSVLYFPPVEYIPHKGTRFGYYRLTL
jgi:hypothetical protein